MYKTAHTPGIWSFGQNTQSDSFILYAHSRTYIQANHEWCTPVILVIEIPKACKRICHKRRPFNSNPLLLSLEGRCIRPYISVTSVDEMSKCGWIQVFFIRAEKLVSWTFNKCIVSSPAQKFGPLI